MPLLQRMWNVAGSRGCAAIARIVADGDCAIADALEVTTAGLMLMMALHCRPSAAFEVAAVSDTLADIAVDNAAATDHE